MTCSDWGRQGFLTKLNVSLINIGVFAAIYMVIMVCISILGFIPVLMVLLDVLVRKASRRKF